LRESALYDNDGDDDDDDDGNGLLLFTRHGNAEDATELNQFRFKAPGARSVNFRRFLYRAAFSSELQTIAPRMLFNPGQ